MQGSSRCRICGIVVRCQRLDRARTLAWLVGRRAIVMGNHIKSLGRFFPSVNFNNMPGPFIGNVTAGGTTNHADFPAPAANFNMIAS